MDLFYDGIGVQLLLKLDDLRLLGICLRQVDLGRHKGTIFLDDFSSLVLIAEFQAILVQKQSDLRADLSLVALVHGKFCAAVTLPVNRLSALLVRKGVDVYLVCHHKCRIEAQTKVTDDLVGIALILILLDEIGGAGESDLVDVLLHLICSHTQTVIHEGERLLIGIDNHIDLRLVPFRKSVLSHHIQLFQLGNCVAAVGDQLSVEDVVIGIQPLLDNRKNVFTVD